MPQQKASQQISQKCQTISLKFASILSSFHLAVSGSTALIRKYLYIFLWFYWLNLRQMEEWRADMNNDYNSGMRRSVNPCWCYCVQCFDWVSTLRFQCKRTWCMPPTKVKWGLACTRAASFQKLNSMKALITRKCAVKNFLLRNVLIFLCSPR